MKLRRLKLTTGLFSDIDFCFLLSQGYSGIFRHAVADKVLPRLNVVGATAPFSRTTIPGSKFVLVRVTGMVEPADACAGFALVIAVMGTSRTTA
jgi:hypothetical protein